MKREKKCLADGGKSLHKFKKNPIFLPGWGQKKGPQLPNSAGRPTKQGETILPGEGEYAETHNREGSQPQNIKSAEDLGKRIKARGDKVRGDSSHFTERSGNYLLNPKGGINKLSQKRGSVAAAKKSPGKRNL